LADQIAHLRPAEVLLLRVAARSSRFAATAPAGAVIG
jgi:hypothetical protein